MIKPWRQGWLGEGPEGWERTEDEQEKRGDEASDQNNQVLQDQVVIRVVQEKEESELTWVAEQILGSCLEIVTIEEGRGIQEG